MEVRPHAMPADLPAVEQFLTTNRKMGQLSENKTSRLDLDGGTGAVGWVGESDGDIVAYAALAPAASSEEWAMEIVTAGPGGDLSALVEASAREAGQRGARRLRWWVYDNMRVPDPVSFGFDPERRLLRMGMPLPAARGPSFPETIRLTGFTVGQDESAWLKANNAAFAGHPENGGLTFQDLELRTAMDWFEADGLRTAWEGEELAGFCWTKIHPTGEGEIYIIGVVPLFQGRGLGRELVLEGMRHLSDRGCDTVMLYTEGDNVAAVALYEDLGMRTEAVNLSFVKALV